MIRLSSDNDNSSDIGSVVLEKEPLEEVAKMGQLRAFLHKGFWQCMDTRRDKEFLEEMWKMDNPPWII